MKRQMQVTIVTFKTPKSKDYIGFCYELAIVLENENHEELLKDLVEAAQGYVSAIQKAKLPANLLDKSQMLPEEYRLLYKELENGIQKKDLVSDKRLPRDYERAVRTGRAQMAMACV